MAHIGDVDSTLLEEFSQLQLACYTIVSTASDAIAEDKRLYVILLDIDIGARSVGESF